MQTNIIPVHVEGKQNDLAHAVALPDRESATDCFKRAKKRLLNPRIWHELGGSFSAVFTLVDQSGDQAKRLAQVGDLYRIDLPGPGTVAGDGYDWVRIDAIDDRGNETADEEIFALRLTPASNPNDPNPETAHFFKAGASSTFVVERRANEVSSSYHGRNELSNTDTDKTLDNIRNAVMGSAALAGLSELQWSGLIKALLEPELGG